MNVIADFILGITTAVKQLLNCFFGIIGYRCIEVESVFIQYPGCVLNRKIFLGYLDTGELPH